MQPPTANVPESVRKALQRQLETWHEGANFPGATVGFSLSDDSIFGLAVGWADREKRIPMKPSGRMLQGSVGKTYVAAVALQLVGEKKLALDDPIEKYLGREKWFPRLPNARDITIRMLMNHTSGLVRYEFKDEFTRDLTRDPMKTRKPEELVAYLLDSKAPFPAGKGWDYSDTNYIVLGMIIERVTRSHYYEEAKRRLLNPLKLRDTIPSDRPALPGLVQGYAGAGNPFGGRDEMLKDGKMVINPQFEWCGGGMASTAEDLARWAKALYTGKAFPASLLPEMLNGVPARLGPDARYGLGVILRPSTLGPTWGHSGFFPGYMTEMAYFPDHRLAVALQVNTSVPRATGKPLFRAVQELAQEIVNAGGKATSPPPAKR